MTPPPEHIALTPEQIARIIEPTAWKVFDAAIRPFAEQRGAGSSEQPLLYGDMWKAGVRTAEQARDYMLNKDIPVLCVDIGLLRNSLTKARDILALSSLGNGKPDVSEGVKASEVIAVCEDLYRFLAQTLNGTPGLGQEGSHANDLQAWRDRVGRLARDLRRDGLTSPTKPDVSGSGEVAAPDDNVVARVRQWLQDYDAQAAEDLEDGEIAKVDAEVEFRRDDIRHLLDLVASPSPEGVQGDLVVPGIFLDLEAARMVYAALNFLQPKNYVSEIREPLEQVLAAFKGQLEVAEAGQQSVALTAAHQTGGETPESGLKS